ncbi:PEGA domain-containing protein [bacterium]|nr:PEGA domain-containing protein [bacterium]
MKRWTVVALFLILVAAAFPAAVQAGTVTGTVENTDGDPITHAHVLLRGNASPPFGHTFTDSSGHYTIENVPTGHYLALAMAEGYEMGEEPVQVEANGTTVVDFILEPMAPPELGSLEGTVHNEQGDPIAHALVRVWIDENIPRWTHTLPTGTFTIDFLPEGEWGVEVLAPGYEPYEDTVEIIADEVTEVSYTLTEAATGTVMGVVMDEEGNGLPFARVLLQVELNRDPHYRTFTDSLGEFTFESVIAREYFLVAFLYGRPEAHVEIEVFEGDTTYVEVTLQDPGNHMGVLEGTVTSVDGDPLPGSMIALHLPNHHRPFRVAFSGESGAYGFDHIPAGEYTAVARHMGFAPAEETVEIVAGETTTLDFVLEEGGAEAGHVEAQVQDEEGRPIVHALMELRPEPHGSNRPLYHLHTNEAGVADFPYVMVGEYTGIARAHGFEREMQAFEVVEGETVELSFTLTEGGGGPWWGEYEPISLEGTVELRGNNLFTHYFLHVDNDDSLDYHLSFGPPWYQPPSGAERPENGDFIEIEGGLIEREQRLPLVIVFELNGETWFDPDSIGRVNGLPYEGTVPLLAEADGMLVIDPNSGEMVLATGNGSDLLPLTFGDDQYQPAGQTRPRDGEWISVVGGWYQDSEVGEAFVVYTVNSEVWRDPGDGRGLDLLGINSVDDGSEESVPFDHLMVNAYPNPFNPLTTLEIALPEASTVQVAVYNTLGQQVMSAYTGRMTAGLHSLSLDASRWASGIYFVQVRAAGEMQTTRLHLLK